MNCKIVPVSEYENGCVVHGRSQLECQAAEIEQLKGVLAAASLGIHEKPEIYDKIRSIPSCDACEKPWTVHRVVRGIQKAVEGAGGCDECMRLLLGGIQTLRNQALTE